MVLLIWNTIIESADVNWGSLRKQVIVVFKIAMSQCKQEILYLEQETVKFRLHWALAIAIAMKNIWLLDH